MHNPLYLLFPLVMFMVLSCTGDNLQQGDPQNGERWYRLNRCNGCHGPAGRGGKAPEIAGLRLSPEKFRKKLRSSGSSIMPSYSRERVSNQDAADLYAYLKAQK